MMSKEELQYLIDEANKRRVVIQETKGAEYTQGNKDRLANFRRAGMDVLPLLREGTLPEQANLVAWLMLFNKHFDALKSFIQHGKEFSSEGIEGRLDDLQVYLDLCRGLVHELKVKMQKEG